MIKSIMIAILAISVSISALSFSEPRPFVAASPFGECYLKMIPLDENGENGKLIVYKVNEEKCDSVLYEINGWYADEAYISQGGEIIIRINYPKSFQSLSQASSRIVIGFYNKGKIIRTYEAGDIVKTSGAVLGEVKGIETFNFIRKVIGFKNVNCKEFEIITSENMQIIFDTNTGKIINKIQKKEKSN